MIKQIVRKIKYTIYPRYCPFCIGNWREFNSHGFEFPVLKKVEIIGGGKRPHVCPNCSSTDRLRMIYSYLKSETKFLDSDYPLKILHIAPERLLMELFKKNNYHHYTAIDKFNFGGDIRFGDITDLEFDDNYFDLVICNHVLEHIDNDLLAMSELNRVLKKNGIAILQVPYSEKISNNIEDSSIKDPRERELHFGQNDHVRIYALNEFEERLNKSNFKTEFISPFSRNWNNEPNKLGLNKKEKLLLAHKK
tara:strand:+ start:2156 stop:2905 length:750 start_codon:yes stop_codon:yes gene_type:complete